YSWLKTLALFREEQLKEKLSVIIQEVSEAIMIQPEDQDLLHEGDLYDLNRRNSITNRFTLFELREIIQESFSKHHLKNTQFEFAVAGDQVLEHYALKSTRFMEMMSDSVHHLKILYPLTPGTGTFMESLTPEEILIIVVPDIKSIVLKSLGWMIAGALIFTVIIIVTFYMTFSALLRQKKLSEMKTDFINNMTHELKTPLATISLAVDALKSEKVIGDETKRAYFTGMIRDENKRMNRHVETILQAAQLQAGDLQLEKKPTHIHALIHQSLEQHALQIEQKHGEVVLKLDAVNDLLSVNEPHFLNLISNLLDNAIKYSRDIPLKITITSRSNARWFRFSIEDNGIGMSRDTLSKIFEKFYRAHTGNLHNVKGFGLGLSYVKTITDAHGGSIKAESVPGKGSIFSLEFPMGG
ncbi:MAG: HAMP domain-containing histidine kinase, partial [Bacteroidetes bacterium]|nr:HAMP domain-containing histidine kinase [Bacteroidota bacterium]